ncbi:MAG: M13 family metallopeptidase [Clostridium sp.]|nr:M13 family metallopeptidase [Clostridium sp.]
MLKRTKMLAFAMVCSLLISQGTYTYAAETTNNSVSENTTQITDTRKQDDFYNAVNKDWLNNAVIEQGKVSDSAFDEISSRLTEQKKSLINELIANKSNYSTDSDEKKIINLYENYMNTEARNNENLIGVNFIFQYLRNVRDVNQLKDLEMHNVSNPMIKFSCSVDLKDATKHALYISPTALTLGDSGEYTKPSADTEHRKDVLTRYCTKILTLSGYSDDEAKSKVDNLFKFEGMIAPYIISKEQASKDETAIDKEYNVVTVDELDEMAPNLNIKDQMKNLNIDNANKIILEQPKWIQGLNDMYTNENLELFKDYIEINNLVSVSAYLGENFTNTQAEFSNELLGSNGDIPLEEKAIATVNSLLDMPFGKAYVNKYFDSQIKTNVEDMIKNIVNNYKSRIDKLDWMSDTTKANAINKLDKLRIKVAYPDKWDDYSSLDIKSYDEGGSLIENVLNIKKFNAEKAFKKLNEDVDKDEFACSPQTVNAFYDPNSNSITIPAGILQKPMYDLNASKEINYGAIGAVIGHEISHAFDTTGAKFDCDGNLSNWWTEEDYNKFKEKTQKVRDYYNTVKTDDGKSVNGDITVGENIADISGVACSLDIIKQMDNPNYKDFFESYANIWRMIATPEYADYCLSFDVHSPNKVRTNVVVGQFEEFYKTYGITENDKMYIKPEDRLQIW